MSHASPSHPGRWPEVTRRITPVQLAKTSLACGLLGPFLFFVSIVALLMVALDGSGDMDQAIGLLAVFVIISAVVLPIVSLASGIMAFQRTHWGTESASRIVALIGLIVSLVFAGALWFVYGATFWPAIGDAFRFIIGVG